MSTNPRTANAVQLIPGLTAGSDCQRLNAVSSSVHGKPNHQIFRAGEIGRIHALAHQLSETGESERGLQVVDGWLDGQTGAGSKWVHLHFHAMLFEIDLGLLIEAQDRLLTHILPYAMSGRSAMTDGPAAMWWLQLASPDNMQLPWSHVANNIEANIKATDSAFVHAHYLLALGGAKNLGQLEAWQTHNPTSTSTSILHGLALSMSLLARSRFPEACDELEQWLHSILRLGGSSVQNDLFARLHLYLDDQSAEMESKLKLDTLGQAKRIFDLNAEIKDRTVDFAMTE